ncbi:MAG: nucleotidyl transferase AbiEii/AbiGii toxin family protein [Bacteroidota bacterium]
MLDFGEIQKAFDGKLKGITSYRSMIKEYLQCKVLEIIYRSPYQSRLVFIGGTRLRLINGFRRFSEDLDFDIMGEYGDRDHRNLLEFLSESMKRQNIPAEPDRDKKTGNSPPFSRYLNFPGIMERMGIKDAPGRKFFIKMDAEKHEYGDFRYDPETSILNRFDVFVPLRCGPLSLILATKMCAILERAKGRDFYDITELVKLTRANTDYIRKRQEFGKLKQMYTGPESYTKPALAALNTIVWKDKAREISKFLFDPSESDKVLLFKEYATEDRIRDWLGAEDNHA